MRARSANILRLLVFGAFVILLQWHSGAYASETSRESDEPAHIVTGLMVRDYLSEGLGRHPIEFARDYYLHYPKVAIGHWPPMFYAEQAAWTLLFPSSRTSLLVMLALQLALLYAMLWPILNRQFGSLAAWLACFVLATLPGVYSQSITVMTEIPIALLIAAAMLAWGRYLESARAWSAVAFGLFSAAAILMKGTGVVLAGIPLLSVFLAGRMDLMRRASFWLPVPIVLLLCAPWYLLAPDAVHQKVAAYGGLGLAESHLTIPVVPWAYELGWVFASLAAVGLVIVLVRRVTIVIPPILASAASLAIAGTIFPLFVAAWETRHIVEVAPAFLLLAAAGVDAIASLPILRSLTSVQQRSILVVGCLVMMDWDVSVVPRQEPRGFRDLAQAIVHQSLGPARTIVVSGDSVSEGTLISEIAQLERRPQRYILRATKLFARIDWMGHLSNLRVTNVSDMANLLDTLPIDLIVIDHEFPAGFAYQAILEQTLLQQPDQWSQVASRPSTSHFAIFRRTHGFDISSAQLETQLRSHVGEPLRQ